MYLFSLYTFWWSNDYTDDDGYDDDADNDNDDEK